MRLVLVLLCAVLSSCAVVQKVGDAASKIECGMNTELGAFTCAVGQVECGKDLTDACWVCDIGGTVDGNTIQNIVKVCPKTP